MPAHVPVSVSRPDILIPEAFFRPPSDHPAAGGPDEHSPDRRANRSRGALASVRRWWSRASEAGPPSA